MFGGGAPFVEAVLARSSVHAHNSLMTNTDEHSRGETLLRSADLSPELIAALDHAVATQTEGGAASPPSRAQLIARVLEDWLRSNGHLRHDGRDEGLRPENLTSENDL
jgi:hypothetical protein